MALKTNVYIDGFNLYYGCVRNTPPRWLDLSALCTKLLPKNKINRIRYFTALVTPRGTVNKSNRSNRECCRPRHRARSYHFVVAVWRAKEAESGQMEVFSLSAKSLGEPNIVAS
jgi:hypothetical protein